MGYLNGLETIAPAILKFPIEKTIKAFINLKLGRKKTSSIIRLSALALGLFLGYNFPQLGSVMAFLIGLVSITPLGPAITASISVVSSMFFSAIVMIYLAKKSLQYYNINKYGVSNPENRFTDNDRKLFAIKFINFSKEDLDKLIKSTEAKITFLTNELNRFNLTGQVLPYKNAKYILNCLKRGEIAAFSDYYYEEISRSSAQASLRQQRLAALLSYDHQLGLDTYEMKATNGELADSKSNKVFRKDIENKSDDNPRRLYELKKKASEPLTDDMANSQPVASLAGVI